MQSFVQDFRYAMRQLRKSPGFTLAAVLTIAIGIGINTAMFSNMDAVVMRPMAVPKMDRVVTIAEQRDRGDISYFPQAALGNYEDWTRQSRSFQETAAVTIQNTSLTGAGDAVKVNAAHTTQGFFRVLQAQPLAGRLFTDDESQPGKGSVAVLGFGFWKRQFGGDPSVLGRTVELDQRQYTVVGVMPKTMQYPPDVDVYLPFAPTPQQAQNRTDHNYVVLARLRDGVTIGQAQADIRTIAAGLERTYPATNRGWTVKVQTLLEGVNGVYTPLYYKMIMGATLFVLLVVCANIANLQLARGIARRPEIAMRSALGASRSRILRQLLSENILLGLIGALGGLVIAAVYLHILLVSMPERVARYMPGWSQTSLNGRAMAFSLVLAIGAGVVTGLLPAIEALRLNLTEQLRSGTRGSIGSGRAHRLRNIFAAAQIALGVALVIGAALMSKGMNGLLHIADAYGPKQALTFSVKLPEARYDTPQKRAAWFADSLARLRALPGVKSAEVTAALPYSDYGWVQDTAIESRPVSSGTFRTAYRMTVSEGYFGALHVPIVAGRGFAASDALGTTPVAVVSRRFVDRYMPGENPLGKRIRMGSNTESATPWVTIVGVAEEVSYEMWDQQRQPAVYLSAAQEPIEQEFYIVRTDGDPLALAAPAHKALAAIDPGLPLDEMRTWDQMIHMTLTGLIYASATLGADGLIALLLAGIGIFGVMANLVGERRREIGVRLALGARREDVMTMILGRAGRLMLIGIGIGLAMAFAMAHALANLLRGVSPNDPLVFTVITAAVALMTLASSWMPARRASRIEPMEALRED
jgi:putative ABC transport system permease protein